MRTKHEILVKWLQIHFNDGAEVFIKDHPRFVETLENAVKDGMREAVEECAEIAAKHMEENEGVTHGVDKRLLQLINELQ